MKPGAIFVWVMLVGCGTEDPCGDRVDPSTTPGGLELTQSEHSLGWGDAECFQCHQSWQIHVVQCMERVDVEEISVQVDVADTESCVSCHGANGVALWTDTGGG